MAVTLNLQPALTITVEKLAELAQINQNLQLELTANGALIIMPPTGGETGDRNFELSGQLWDWNRKKCLGKAFDSSTGFRLPNGAVRSPDVSWIKLERWEELTPEQRKKCLPLCPDFAVELVSETDEIQTTRSKMQEYLTTGLRLGWLIDPETKTVEIYRQNRPVEILQCPPTLSGEKVLPDFILILQPIW